MTNSVNTKNPSNRRIQPSKKRKRDTGDNTSIERPTTRSRSLKKHAQDIKNAPFDQIKHKVLNNFQLLNDDDIYLIITRDYKRPAEKQFIKQALYSIVNYLDFSNERLQKICKQQDIAVFDDDIYHNGPVFSKNYYSFSKENYYTQESPFSCSNIYGLSIFSDKMLDAALNWEKTNSNNLSFIFDNFIMSDESYDNNYDENHHYTIFRNQESRNKVFMHQNLDYEVLEWLNDYKENHDEGIISYYPEDELISKEAAQTAYETTLNINKANRYYSAHQRQKKTAKELLRNNEISKHLEVYQIDILNNKINYL